MIKFPKVHIATSVMSRILDLADGIPDPAPPSDGPRAPTGAVADTATQSQAIDARVSQATPDVGGIDKAPDPGATLSGDSLLDTMLTPGQ